MKRIPFLAFVLLAFAFPAHAQDAMKKDAADKPAEPEVKVVLDSWNEIGRKLTAMAEDFPEDKYDFKPTPAQRSFAEQLLHAAGSNYYFTDTAMGRKPPAGADPKRDQYKTKADIVAFVKKSFADGAAAIQSKGEKGMMTEFVYFPHQKARVLDIAYGIIEHSGEHYGQLVVYYRLAGLVPPESRPKKLSSRDQVPRPYRAPSARMGGDFGFWNLSIQCAARHMDISAFVPLQDLGFDRRAARLAVQCVFRNEEETRSEFVSLIRQRPNGV